MRPIKLMCLLLPFLALGQTSKVEDLQKEFFVCYGKIAPESVIGYKVVIIESQLFTAQEIAIFKKNNTKVLGYLSLTEIHPSSKIFNDLKDHSFGKNDNWGSYYIDISKEEAQLVLEHEISRMMHKGVDGLFLDNLDNVSQWGPLKNQEKKLIKFLKSIKKKHENIYMVQNAGLFISKQLKNTTDVILVESVVTLYNFNTNTYNLRPVEGKLALLKELNQIASRKKQDIFILEYANSKVLKQHVEKELNQLNYPFFVANIDLQTAPKIEPEE